MADRSIVVKLKADIGDLRSKMTAASASIKDVATTAEQAGSKSGSSLGKIGTGLSKGLDGIDKHKQSIRTIGTGFTVLGVAAAAGVGVAVKSFADFDEAISHVKATGSDAATNIDALRQAALKAGADTKYSATEAAAGVESLLKAGVSAQDVLGGGLDGALALAASGNLDVASSAEVAASAMTQFGLQGAQVPHIADLLAAGAGKAQGEVSDMGAALNQAGLVASGFGLSIEETVGSLAAFASAGLTGSDAGTSFKTMIQRLQNPTDDAAATMKQLGLNVYDAQGKFVGMAQFAEQLKTQLSGLTDEQRNAALETIFGADAIRGANVLYKEGGQGITDWTSKVNDAGYASEQAAARMDNLKGDFEQLTGSLDTALIQSGSGANDMLRGLAQGATDSVNAFGKLPSEVQQGALGLVALVAAGALTIAGLAKVAVGAAEAKAALAALNITGATTTATLGRLGAVAAPVAVALLAAEAAGHVLDTYGAKVGSQDDVTSQLVALAAAQDQAAASSVRFDSAFPEPNKLNFLAQAVGYDVTAVTSLDQALAVSTAGGVRGYQVGFESLLESIRPGKQSLERMRDGITQVDTGLASLVQSGHADQAASAFEKILARNPNLDPAKVATEFGAYQGELEKTAKSLGVTTLSAKDYADWMGGKVPVAITAAAKANPQAAAAFGLTGAAAEKQTVSVQDALQSLYAYASAMDAVSASAGGAEEAIDAANAVIGAKGFKETHDQGTKQGRANQSALDNVGSKSRDALGDLATGGASQQAIDDAAKHYRKAYRQIAEDIGYSGKAARAFADDLIRTPKAVNVRVVTPGAKISADQAAVLNHELQSIPENKRAKIVTIAETKGAKAAQQAIERIKDKKVIAKATGDSKGPINVKKALDALHDRLVLAKARGDKKGADDVRAAIAKVKSKNVTVSADANGISQVYALRSAIATVKGKTVTVKVRRTGDRGDADGGYIDSTFPGYDGGGRIQGSGGPREDNVAGIDRATGVQTSWVSVGEMVTNARSTANNFGALATINANPDKRYGLVELAKGGLPRYAKGSTDTDVARVVSLQQAVDEARNLAELSKALKAQAKATKSLTDAEQASTDAVKELSGSLSENYRSKSTDVDDVLAQLQQGAADLSTFGAQLAQLKAAGLSQGVIDQLTADGAVNGGEVAQGILAGGQAMIDALNKANAGLEQAAANVGLTANGVKVKGHAYGGLVEGYGTGTSDDNLRRLSAGEFVVRESVARSNLAFLTRFNAGQQALPAYARAAVPATSLSHRIDNSDNSRVEITGVIGDPDVWLRKANNQKRDRRAMSGFAVR